MMEEQNRPKVGVGVVVFKDGKVLLGKRKGSHGAGEYASPGGHLEYLESFADCAAREVREECGIAITNVRFQFVANLTAYAPKHYIHIQLLADWQSGDPQVLEPEKVELWDWYDVNNLPQPMFATYQMVQDSMHTGTHYYDAPTDG